MIQRKKSLATYCREKRLREGKPLYAARPLQPLNPKSATGRPSGAQDASQPVKRPRATLKPQSAKARALVPLRKQTIAAVRARSGGRCEIRIEGVCDGPSCDVHEILARSQGGSITNVDNCLDSCRSCHDWVGAHSNTARELGFIAPRGA